MRPLRAEHLRSGHDPRHARSFVWEHRFRRPLPFLRSSRDQTDSGCLAALTPLAPTVLCKGAPPARGVHGRTARASRAAQVTDDGGSRVAWLGGGGVRWCTALRSCARWIRPSHKKHETSPTRAWAARASSASRVSLSCRECPREADARQHHGRTSVRSRHDVALVRRDPDRARALRPKVLLLPRASDLEARQGVSVRAGTDPFTRSRTRTKKSWGHRVHP